MRLSVALVLAACAGCAGADDPSPPVKVGAEWKKLSYKALENSAGAQSETWHYMGEPGAVLFVTRTGCTSCKSVGHESIRITNKRPNDVSILVQSEHDTAEFSISTEALEHLTTSYALITDTYAYGIYLTVTDDISARESMELQQKLLRMVQNWAPE